jgi:hypothetical protein
VPTPAELLREINGKALADVMLAGAAPGRPGAKPGAVAAEPAAAAPRHRRRW